jgi:hypothetical protein
VRLEGLGKLKNFNDLIGSRTRDLLSCIIAPQPHATADIHITFVFLLNPYTIQESDIFLFTNNHLVELFHKRMVQEVHPFQVPSSIALLHSFLTSGLTEPRNTYSSEAPPFP